MVEQNIEKSTGMWVGLFVLVLSLVYIFVTMGKTDWIRWIAIIWGFFLAGLLYLESGVITYFKKSDFKKISFGDIVVWLSVAFGTLILVNTFLLIGTMKEQVPIWLANFATSTGVISGVVGALLGVVHMVMPRFK